MCCTWSHITHICWCEVFVLNILLCFKYWLLCQWTLTSKIKTQYWSVLFIYLDANIIVLLHLLVILIMISLSSLKIHVMFTHWNNQWSHSFHDITWEYGTFHNKTDQKRTPPEGTHVTWLDVEVMCQVILQVKGGGVIFIVPRCWKQRNANKGVFYKAVIVFLISYQWLNRLFDQGLCCQSYAAKYINFI